jgi:hypothetical protein
LAVTAVRLGVGGFERSGNALTHRVVKEESVSRRFDERECAQSVERILRRAVGQHGGQQGDRHPSYDRRGIEGLPGWRLEIGQ